MIQLLKGRRRFLADLESAKASTSTYEAPNVKIQSVGNGDEEGFISLELVDSIGHDLTTLHLLVSDTTDYPQNHSFICYIPDGKADAPPLIAEIAEGVAAMGPVTVNEILSHILSSVSNKLTIGGERRFHTQGYRNGGDIPNGEDEDSSNGEHRDSEAASGSTHDGWDSKIQTEYLRRDFNEVVAAGYRPGIVRIASPDMAVSVSTPVTKLAEVIPPRVLMAWDERILSKTHHFTLLISGSHSIYPVLRSDGTLIDTSNELQFQIGLTSGYKPSQYYYKETDNEVSSRFPFRLSASLEPLMQDRLIGAIQLRLKFGIGWAGAELLLGESARRQAKPEDIYETMHQAIIAADQDERGLHDRFNLPTDYLTERKEKAHLNLPLLSFSYLLRRLILCTRYCLLCYNRLPVDYEILKPYVCADRLCTYQYYNLDRGTSLEYEICTRPTTVDLLVSLAYMAAASRCCEGPFPVGIGLMVPVPAVQGHFLVEFDTLDMNEKCKAVVDLLRTIPPVPDMRRYLMEKEITGTRRPRLQNMNQNILPAAWLILRWCVASCTAHLEEVASSGDRIRNIDCRWRQFRFSVGAPDAEAKFKRAQKEAQSRDPNMREYPSLWAFHGSRMQNWHSIIRHGLWYKKVANGRTYGDGVYLAKNGNISMSQYAKSTETRWPNTRLSPLKCVALVEIVNQPQDFQSSQPHFVVSQREWIICRYLLVDCVRPGGNSGAPDLTDATVPFVKLDPKHPLTLSKEYIQIPDPDFQLKKLLTARKMEFSEEEYDENDQRVFAGNDLILLPGSYGTDAQIQGQAVNQQEGRDSWVHNPGWVEQCLVCLPPPPSDSMSKATVALRKELGSCLKDQETAKSLKQLGWYIPPECRGDNLFQWIVEMHSFEEELPLAADMKTCGVNSLVLEIRFPPEFPHSPPFFRVLRPRILPFSKGGGVHVNRGGSICMDLLMADAWLPSYSIPAILAQIRLALSNLEPRPTRLDANWDMPYSMAEAITGLKRAVVCHGRRRSSKGV